MVLWFGISVVEFQVRGFRGSGCLERGLGIRGFAVLGVVFRVFEFRIRFGVSLFGVSGSGFRFRGFRGTAC